MTTAAKKALRFGDKLLVPVATGAVGSVIANQVPQNTRPSKATSIKIKDRVRKNLTPIIKSAHEYFDTDYAQYCADLVMEMDEDEAEMFTYLVMADVLENDIAKNRRTLQAHLNEVVEKRYERVKKAMLSSVSKGATDEALEYAEILETFEKAAQPRNPYQFGFYEFEESDFRRDPRTGRFMTKVKQNPNARVLGDKQAANLGIKVDTKQYKNIKRDPDLAAKYQNEYMQVVNFLNAADAAMGNAHVAIQIGDNAGNRYWRTLSGPPKTPGVDWDPRNERVLAVEAQPTGDLSLGGAAFGLVPALGAQAAQGINAASRQMPKFSQDWSRDDYDPENSNARLYNRVKTGSEFVTAVAPKGSNAALAARFGRAVGEHGPQAEKVIGPSMRKTAYRYRGTEKKPDREALRQYELETTRVNAPEADLKLRARKRAALSRAINDEKRRRAAAHNALPENKKAGKGIEWHSIKLDRADEGRIMQQVEERFKTDPGAVELSPEARAAGRQVLINYLNERDPETGKPLRGPRKDLYRLHLESGVTPPSQGFIIDKDGKVVTEAVGYGDDHYLPFNLKNLKKLRGGEYVRTRSVGGPTSEDIYTGLMAGAQQVTVVSRSGTFTIKFKEDFKGKRRYNDKAMRMTRRYEQLLDTVQSGQVERDLPIAPEVRQFITAQVRNEGYDRTETREEVKRRVKEYKEELNAISDEAEFRELVEEYIGARAEAEGGDLPEAERNRLEQQLRNDWQSQNEYYFRLNGMGYRDALIALQEQFPYYFDVDYKTTREREQGRVETELDRGYVEPGRNRPTKARAGFYGTSESTGGSVGSQKFSASQANYQRGRGIKGSFTPYGSGNAKSEENETTAAPGTPGKKAEFQEKRAQVEFLNAAVALQQAIRRKANDQQKEQYPILDLDDNAARDRLKSDLEAKKFDDFVQDNKAELGKFIDRSLLNKYASASGKVGRKEYDDVLALNPKAKPFLFPEKAYGSEATDADVKREQKALSARVRPVSVEKDIADFSEAELELEIEMVANIKQVMADIEDASERKELLREDYGLRGPHVERLSDEDKLNKHLKDIWRQRALNMKKGDTKTPAGVKTSSTTRHIAPAEGSPSAKLDVEQESRRQELLQLQREYSRAAEYYADRRGEKYNEERMERAADLLDAAIQAGFFEADDVKRVKSQLTKDDEKWRQHALLRSEGK